MNTRTVSLLLCGLDYVVSEEFSNRPGETKMREREREATQKRRGARDAAASGRVRGSLLEDKRPTA